VLLLSQKILAQCSIRARHLVKEKTPILVSYFYKNNKESIESCKLLSKVVISLTYPETRHINDIPIPIKAYARMP